MNNLPYFLALNRMDRVGPRTVLKLVQHWPDLNQMFQLTQAELEKQGLPVALAQKIAQFDLNEVYEDFKWQNAAQDHHLISYDSPHYPALLKEIADPPMILYAKGLLASLDQPTVAMVGSRNPSVTGQDNAKKFAKELAQHGITIASGLALGIDGEAHRGCLETPKGLTIAVMGTGIDRIYPQRHANLAQKISSQGLILTEFPLKSPPIAGHFPLRNRIISGLSLCTLVVEAAVKSGSLITARMALDQNRDVLAIPGSIHNPMARGCNYLLQQGAKLVTSTSDVLEELGIDSTGINHDKPLLPLASKKENLVQFIGFETTTVDQVMVRSGYTIEKVRNDLAELELQGAITSVQGGYIRRDYER